MKSVLRKILLVLVVIVLLAATIPGYHYYQYFTSHVSTDDAYVDGSVALISARIPGTVARLYVMENWHVNAGDPLLALDPRDYQVRLRSGAGSTRKGAPVGRSEFRSARGG